jgi:leucyl aminopeptidase
MIKLESTQKSFDNAELKIIGAFTKTGKDKKSTTIDIKSVDKELVQSVKAVKAFQNFKAGKGETLSATGAEGETILVWGLGDKSKFSKEDLRRVTANLFKAVSSKNYKTIALDALSFHGISKKEETLALIHEAIEMTSYKFDKYFSKKSERSFKHISLYIEDGKLKTKANKLIKTHMNLADSVNFCRTLIDEVPNVLNSVEYAKVIEKDVRTALKGKGVRVKTLGKAELKKEKMGCFLAVNAGSAYDPRLVHLTYTPKKVTKNTKHIALVGKGLTFDTGGYSLKPGGAMMGMKFDMGGSATVYGAFRAAVLNNAPVKITCILGMTDNAVNSKATFPDSIVTSRKGLTVEILNTDAEGRLVLADCLDYASDQNPDQIIDAATLTGACLVALGSQVGAVLGNSQKFADSLLKHAKSNDEYLWQLPIVNEWRDDMKSKIADLKNIGTGGRAGTATAAAFLENFIGEGIEWAHLDVAGVAGDQAHLPYCPAKGGSGILVRTLADYMVNGK